MTTRCEPFAGALREATNGGAVELSDGFALHLDDCPDCRRAFDRGAVPLDPASFERLDASARDRLLRARAGAGRARRWLVAAAAAAAIAAVGLLALTLRRATSAVPPDVAVALVEDHIRYLAAADRRSSASPAELTRELSGYVDFPVLLPQAAGAELTGARRCYLLGRRVVLAFYAAGEAPLSYFVLPANDLSPPGEACGAGGLRCASEHGFAVVTWPQAGLLHGVVAGERSVASTFADAVRSISHERPAPSTTGQERSIER